MNYNQAPTVNSNQSSGLSLNINPSNLINAFQTATTLSNTFNSIKDKVQPPSRPAPSPQNNMQNPLIPAYVFLRLNKVKDYFIFIKLF